MKRWLEKCVTFLKIQVQIPTAAEVFVSETLNPWRLRWSWLLKSPPLPGRLIILEEPVYFRKCKASLGHVFWPKTICILNLIRFSCFLNLSSWFFLICHPEFLSPNLCRMAPEVAAVEKNGGYNQLCDIWAVGITSIELAELQPPMFDLHPMRYVLFSIKMISRRFLRWYLAYFQLLSVLHVWSHLWLIEWSSYKKKGFTRRSYKPFHLS